MNIKESYISLVDDFYNKLSSDISRTYFPNVKYYRDDKNNAACSYALERFSNGVLGYDSLVKILSKNCKENPAVIEEMIQKYINKNLEENYTMKHNDKVRLALETIEEAVDKKIKKLEEDNQSDVAMKIGGSQNGAGLHPTTKEKLTQLFSTISSILKSGNLDEGSSVEEIKAEMAAVQAALKAEKSRQSIHGEYQKKLSEIDKEFGSTAAKDKKTAKVQPPAKAALKSAPEKPKGNK